MRMVRKQIYITENQDEQLKQLSKALEVSEAEIIRRALDGLLGDFPFSRLKLPAEVIDRLMARRLPTHEGLPIGRG